MRGKQARGPQQQVKLAASTEEQSGSRAAHFTAKATSVAQEPKRVVDPGGVGRAARVQGKVRNTRGPSGPPLSRQGGSYKSKTKSSAVQRESEGIVVPKSEALVSRCHDDLRDVIAGLNPVLRGWGNYFRTGNAARCFNQIDTYVWRRLVSLRIARKGRNLQPNEWRKWTRELFHNLGLHRLRGTVRYPESAFWQKALA